MISVTILTKNSEKYLREVLEPLSPFDEVVIFDNGSSDQTLEIAKQFSNVSIHQGIFSGFGPTHNHASHLAKNDWILSIDSDEIVTPEMIAEIKQTPLSDTCVYSFPRHNYFNGKFIRWCGWYPDRQYRLYHRKKTSFTNAQVHEAIQTDQLTKIALQSPLIHYSYGSLSDFLSKMQSYSELFAKQNQGKKSSSITKAILHGSFAFFKSYILKRGFMGGYEGFVISTYNANTAFYKYLKLYEANKSDKC
ncbi:glycosyltransferase family 2 protein [Parachlamydia acanthamoebae]|uniref:Lipopolysaccharide core biosynthesis glycosyltransferase waaE n=2 Tax=Parachlamydia acanthamoebae TaxID=83552 RepID=F8KVD0_PARAV|nr:glycosyltransferase family 2 protein [Parachlamydia acanthamoebae]KIA76676.1 Lipopolysaccharide core biosynthesis glycosyltransferase WaaE [Parachlamydia acanthamoebae]CCB87653.1 lipopolysaccharide core biosynthesis glycosyltransferase waaE [Parachlamydia acanthamoebae UV-7]